MAEMSKAEEYESMVQFDDLNEDCVREVLKQLSFQELIGTERTSQSWKSIVHEVLKEKKKLFYEESKDRNGERSYLIDSLLTKSGLNADQFSALLKKLKNVTIIRTGYSLFEGQSNVNIELLNRCLESFSRLTVFEFGPNLVWDADFCSEVESAGPLPQQVKALFGKVESLSFMKAAIDARSIKTLIDWTTKLSELTLIITQQDSIDLLSDLPFGIKHLHLIDATFCIDLVVTPSHNFTRLISSLKSLLISDHLSQLIDIAQLPSSLPNLTRLRFDGEEFDGALVELLTRSQRLKVLETNKIYLESIVNRRLALEELRTVDLTIGSQAANIATDIHIFSFFFKLIPNVQRLSLDFHKTECINQACPHLRLNPLRQPEPSVFPFCGWKITDEIFKLKKLTVLNLFDCGPVNDLSLQMNIEHQVARCLRKVTIPNHSSSPLWQWLELMQKLPKLQFVVDRYQFCYLMAFNNNVAPRNVLCVF